MSFFKLVTLICVYQYNRSIYFKHQKHYVMIALKIVDTPKYLKTFIKFLTRSGGNYYANV